MSNIFSLVIILLFLLGSCTVMSGDVHHWPAMLIATLLILTLKIFNDRKKLLSWPMEFLLFAAVTMIIVNLAWLFFFELPA